MVRFDDLPIELLQRVIDYAKEEVRGIPCTRWFLTLRRICRTFNACVQHTIYSRPFNDWNWNIAPATGKLKLFDLVLNQGGADDGKQLVVAIRKAMEYAVRAQAGTAAPMDSIKSTTREQYSRAITNVVFRVIHIRYTESIAGVVQGIEGKSYHLTFSKNETHALAVLAAAQEGDVAMLGVLLSHNNSFNPPPGFLSLFPGPLYQAIRRHHIDAAMFLLARFDSHGDVDRPDAPNAKGDYPLHSAARLGSIPLVKFLLSHPLSPNVNIVSRTHPSGQMTPLEAAAKAGHLDLVKYLFALPGIWRTGLAGQYGGQNGGKTLLFYAVEAQSMEMIEFLIAQLETVITAPQTVDSPVRMATQLGRLDLVKLLLENGRADSEAELAKIYHSCLDLAIKGIALDRSLLFGAIVSGRHGMFEKLVERGEFDSAVYRDALIRAVAKGDLHLMQRVIDMGKMDLGSADPQYARIFLAWARGRSDVIELLKRRGVVPHDAVPAW